MGLSIDNLIGDIYDACLSPALWARVQSDICTLTGGVGSHLVLFGKDRVPLETLIISSLGDDFAKSMEADYFNWYHRFDKRRVEKVVAQGPGVVVSNEDLTSPSERKTCPLYNEYFSRFESQIQLIYGTPLLSGRTLTFCQARPKKSGSYSHEENSLFTRMSDHVARSLGMRGKVEGLFGQQITFLDMASEESNAVMVINAQHKVLWSNPTADKLVAGDENIQRHRGVLSVKNTDERAALDRLISQAITLSGEGKTRCGFSTVSSNSGSLVLTAFSTRYPGTLSAEGQAVAVLVFKNPRHAGMPPLSLIQSHFDLTPAEAKVALALAKGFSVKEYGEQSGLTANTIRSTLKLVMDKTDCHRQPELVREICTLVQ